MSVLLALAIASSLLSGFTALLFLQNLSLYLAPDAAKAQAAARASILIPARDEERCIEACVEAAMRTEGCSFDVIVLDDASTDRTKEIVQAIARNDPRVRVEDASPLPEHWCGKQHACFELSQHATGDWLIFIDADVQLASDAAARAIQFAIDSDSPLVSGFPRQLTETWLEKLLIPLIHFVLLGFLPIARMRDSISPAYGAGCGQLFVARRDIYERVGGHAAIRSSLHDGVKLPRAFRSAGFRTDLFDATNLATCRMYGSAREVWNGLSKNATEGIASPMAIVPWTIVLGVGQILPIVLIVFAVADPSLRNRIAIGTISAISLAMSIAVRATAAVRFKQSIVGAILHPIGIAVLLMIQWFALFRKLFGQKPEWKGRAYAA